MRLPIQIFFIKKQIAIFPHTTNKENSIKVLFTTHHTAFLNPSGAEIELLQALDFLRSNGIDVDLFDTSTTDLASYNVFIHFGTNLDGLHLLKQCKKIGKPIFLYPNLWINDSYIDNLNIIESFFKLADYYIFKSIAEKNNCMESILIDSSRTFVVPSGVDSRFFSINSDLGNTFKNLYGLSDYLLCIASFTPEQGQLEIVKALYNFDAPLVFIGSSPDDKYLLECAESSNKHNIFIRNASYGSNLILGAIEGCNLYFELKKCPAGLSALESGAAGKRMILNQNSWTTEIFEDFAMSIAAPYDYDIIKSQIYDCLNYDSNHQNLLSKFITDNHNLHNCYSKLIQILRSTL